MRGKLDPFQNGRYDSMHGIMCLVQALLGPMVAAYFVMRLCQWWGWDAQPPSFWILMAPVVYLLWLLTLLGCYAVETTFLGFFFVKPRRYHSREGGAGPFLITIMLYGHGFILSTLPLMPLLIRSRFLAWLIMRAYSPRAYLARGAWLANLVTDPDLTVIGREVTIGEGSHIVAHSCMRTIDGAVLYQSALVRLEAGCTVSGGAQIEMGVTVGEGSIVEPCSRVLPFTQIPPGEVWGGNPAVFRRKRDSAVGSGKSAMPDAEHGKTATPEDAAALHRLVAGALGVAVERITAESSARNCVEWDSIGRMAIAAALYDRFGINLPPEAVQNLDSMAAVRKMVSGGRKEFNVVEAIALPADPELLPLLDPEAVLAALSQQAEVSNTVRKKVRVVVAATFVATPLASALKLFSRAFGLEAEVEFFDFNQVPQALLGAESSMRKNRTGLNVVLVRAEDWPGRSVDERKVVGGQFLDAVKNFAATVGGALLVSDLPPVTEAGAQERPAERDELQAWWRAQLASISGVEILGVTEIIKELGRAASRAARSADEAAVPYSPAVYQRLGVEITRTLRKLNFPAKKVLALDADNTLWGGVLGEDGLDGIQLAEAGLGRAFKNLQEKILALKQRGVLLALVSKNLPEDVWNAMEKHPQMLLRRTDFAGARINWAPKSKNLRELAVELNLGLDAFVFLDDNPAERLEVAANCPEVTVVSLPERPEEYVDTLARLWCFDGVGATAEDAKRNEYAQEAARRKEFQESVGLETYLKELELKVVMRAAKDEDLARVSQLLQKTNQFNLSLKRRSLPETRQLLPEHHIWVVFVTDRFGDYGMVGVCIARPERELVLLDSFLMSCRALGRGAETAFLHGVAQAARQVGAKFLRGEFVAGPRNQPIQEFLAKSGFTNGNGSVYELNLDRAPAPPAHLELRIEDTP